MSAKAFAAAAAAGSAALLSYATMTMAAEIRLIGATPMTTVIKELGARFARDTGHTLTATFFSGPVVKREIDAGRAFDVAVSITPVIDALIKEGKVVATTRVDVAYAGVGVGVRSGAPKPDIGTIDTFRRALLNAKSVAHSAEGASGDYFKNLLERLGIAEQMRPKLRPMAPDRLAKAVSSGDAEMIVVTMSVIVAGAAELVGPVPSELQFYNAFAGGVGASAGQADAAKAFISLLTAPAAVPVIKASGMEPGAPR